MIDQANMTNASSAEPHQKGMEPQTLSLDQLDNIHVQLDDHDRQLGHDDNSGAGFGLRIGQPDGLMSPTSSTTCNLPLGTSLTTTKTPSTHSLPSISLLSSSSSSQPSESLPPSLSFSSSDHSSPSASETSEDDAFSQKQIYNLKETKEISMLNNGHGTVTKRDVGWKAEDDNYPEDVVLEGAAE